MADVQTQPLKRCLNALDHGIRPASIHNWLSTAPFNQRHLPTISRSMQLEPIVAAPPAGNPDGSGWSRILPKPLFVSFCQVQLEHGYYMLSPPRLSVDGNMMRCRSGSERTYDTLCGLSTATVIVASTNATIDMAVNSACYKQWAEVLMKLIVEPRTSFSCTTGHTNHRRKYDGPNRNRTHSATKPSAVVKLPRWTSASEIGKDH